MSGWATAQRSTCKRSRSRSTWLDDGSLDLVVCALAYHYLNDRPAFLAEVHRMLRPGGSVVISTHHPTDDWVRLGGSYFTSVPSPRRWSRGWEVTAWRLPLTLLTEEFADAGFVIERLVEPLPEPSMRADHRKAFEKLSVSPRSSCSASARPDQPASHRRSADGCGRVVSCN